jgi:hypothetical protein
MVLQSIKAMVFSELVSCGRGRDHPEFKEVYQMTTQGVTFVLVSIAWQFNACNNKCECLLRVVCKMGR